MEALSLSLCLPLPLQFISRCFPLPTAWRAVLTAVQGVSCAPVALERFFSPWSAESAVVCWVRGKGKDDGHVTVKHKYIYVDLLGLSHDHGPDFSKCQRS